MIKAWPTTIQGMASSHAEYPAPAVVERLLSQYAPVRLTAETSHLTPGDREALGHLVDAAGWIDRIYWHQRSELGWTLRQRLEDAGEGAPRGLDRLLALGFGPWDVFDSDRPFWGDAPRSPGGGHYPHDLTRDELDAYVAQHPSERDALLSPTTLIRRDGRRLIGVPFAEAFHDDLARAGLALERASRHASNTRFAEFLRARAAGLTTGGLAPSEALWTGVGDSPIDIAIGPYEVYDDGLLGVKASYEATVLVRHPMSDQLADFETRAPELSAMLPGAVGAPAERQRIAIGVYDVLYAAGSTNMGAKAVAAMLPNDETIRRRHGSRLLLFRNVISAKFTPILKPLAAQALAEDQVHLVDHDAFLMHTLLHEMSHALVPDAGEARPAGHQPLKERYSTIEECRADLVGLVLLDHLVTSGVLPAGMRAPAAITFIAGGLRVLRFGSGNDYGRAAAITLSHLWRFGAITTGPGRRLRVDVEKTWGAIKALAARVQAIAVSGRYHDAGTLIGELGALPPPITALLAGITGLPVDLEFQFVVTPQAS